MVYSFNHMGLALPALRLIIEEHKKKPLEGPILTIGRQCIYATLDDIRALLMGEDLKIHDIPSDQSLETNIPAWENSPNSKYTSDQVFFKMLTGLPVFALDVSDYEGAEYVWDLNNPIPEHLLHMFGTVIDSGSLEHVFDIKQGLINMNRLTSNNGRIIHLTPANNYLEHGFYQFSPTLFIDYYGANNFKKISCLLIQQPILDSNKNWHIWEWNLQRPCANLMTNKMAVLFVVAQKSEHSTEDNIPQQGQYSRHGEGGRTGEFSMNSFQKKVIERLPQSVITIIKRILRKDLKIKPWGLKYVGRV